MPERLTSAAGPSDQERVAGFDAFFSPLPSLAISIVLLAVVCWLAWRGRGRKLALAICIGLASRYMLWRGLYTLNLDSGLAIGISLTLFAAEIYGYFQLLLFSYQVWSTTERESPALVRHPSVDMMVTVVDEPIYILERTLLGCLAQDYPKDRLQVHVLDDGRREEVRQLASELGVNYLTRPDRAHAKAGNLNNGLRHSSGELVAFFDVDHVPVPDFLARTVGFFQEERVAIVQTAQGFYNPDIFQRSVGRRKKLHNEQDLFFRMVQAGRDRHDSAFFAGSSGLIRRSALMEIGGFQTETITEDIHTSLMLHAKGWESRYLNEPLAFGLMPETFEAHRKQRSRWATGTAQMFVLQNPLVTQGLSWPQRLDYFGSIFYFFFGLPRVVFLIAPVSWLLLSIPAVQADAGAILNFFLSAYLASVLTLRLVSRNTRNAFWSDVHETAVCFELVRASVAGLLSARKSRSFEVTPKGARLERQGFGRTSAVVWHLSLLALLILGLANGVHQVLSSSPVQGLAVSLGWASFNSLLLGAAISAARERRQEREFVRRVGRQPCQVVVGADAADAEMLDVSEAGAELQVQAPMYMLEKHVRIVLREEDELLTLEGVVVRQELPATGGARIGVHFEDADPEAMRRLIHRSFASAGTPDESEASGGDGVLASLWALLSVPWWRLESRHPSRRRTPRLAFERPCRLQYEGSILPGTTRDISYAGVSVLLSGRRAVEKLPGVLSIEDVKLAVRPIECVDLGEDTLVRFHVEAITQGAPTWQAWHASQD